MILRLGTRKSLLARTQSLWVLSELQRLLALKGEAPLRIELVEIVTKGDRLIEQPLPEIGGKGLFTLELEQALLVGEIDFAVHSLKDLPTKLDGAFVLGAIPARESWRDVLVSKHHCSLDGLPINATVGTSSLRREFQLRQIRPDIKVVSIRGNIDSRVRKAHDLASIYDAIILAEAGLVRLGRSSVIDQRFKANQLLPAPGQGALAVQCLKNNEAMCSILSALDCAVTRTVVTAERMVLEVMDVGCSAPVAALARFVEGHLVLEARSVRASSGEIVTFKARAVCPEPNLVVARQLGGQVAERLLEGFVSE